jgi:hypothetical protein
VAANRNEIIHLPIKSPLLKAPALDMPLVKTMTNGEYLRLCQKHGVAPIYLDERPKREKRKQAKPGVVQTLGDGFVLVTSIELPKQKAKKPLRKLAERPIAKVKTKRSERPVAKVETKRSERLLARAQSRQYRRFTPEELKRLEREEARYLPRTASIETRRSFSGGKLTKGSK